MLQHIADGRKPAVMTIGKGQETGSILSSSNAIGKTASFSKPSMHIN